jgi:hypothetical protein
MAGYELINNVALRNYASAKVFEKFIQSVIHVNGKGVDESFITQEVLGSASIAVPRVNLGEGAFRTLGATVNGGQFNSNAAVVPASNYFYVPLLYVYDRVESLAKIMNDKAGYALLDKVSENIGLKMARGINALTLATQISQTLNDSYTGSAATFVTESDGVSAYDAYIAANALLDEGDEAIDCDFFPTEFRQALVRPSFFADFKTGAGTRFVVSSNLGQEMLANGVLNPFVDDKASMRVDMRDGYCGEVDGVPVYKVSPVLWKLAAKYTVSGSTVLAETAFNDIDALICSGIGTIRGFSSNGNIDVGENPNGQGWLLKPLVHGGVSCVSGKSVRLIVKSTFTNPVTSNATKLSVLPIESQSA